jgi:TRAP transporter TAXI family solute receptor
VVLVVRVAVLARLLVVLAAMLLAACGSGPPEDEVRKALQAQLDSALDGRVLTVSRFTRAGSAPRREGDGRIVHFNAQLILERDYDFTKWDAHNVASLAAIVGAGPKGIVGLKEGGNRKGDTLGVYGSAAFAREGSTWRQLAVALPADAAEPQRVPAATVSAVQPGPRELPPATPLEQSLARLDTLLKSPAPVAVGTAERDAIVREELESAMIAMRRRLDQAASLIVLAAGPEDGAYAETAAALAARAREAHVAFAILDSQGSVENVRLLGERKAQFALVQNDVARNAQLGRGRFAGAPQELRAVASLFPEPVHLVARERGGVASVSDLKAKRVNLGPDGSGTRSNALAVLAAHGLGVDALAETTALPLAEALAALAEGKLDAVFGTIHAPGRALQRAFAASPLVLVPIGPARELLDAGFVPLTLPARTYARQAGPVPTVAATAMLVTRPDVPQAQVEAMTGLLFQRKEGAATAAVGQIGAATARNGVTIPWHPGAEAALARAGAAAAPAR